MDNFDLRKYLAEGRLYKEQYSSERLNPREIELNSEITNYYFDTIDTIDLDKGYQVKVTSTYYFRKPGTKGYNEENNSEENPGITGVKTTLMDESGKPIKNHNFTGSSNQWMVLLSGKDKYIPFIKTWWEEKMSKMGI